ncbi:MAG TPA: Rieske 2Fe-2S domain-containing protein [Alphaproteobacteria bacterium]|nr:Rieske 2Fe-2S domain-containing protein [Alphaproteobacteria bacterium]
MLSQKDNDLLTLTGPGTPMGNLIRRYWVPALLSEEIPEPDCPPVRVRIMNEELVAFRDSNGRIGLIGEHCRHRGASLFYGRNEECGLRCIYHGWKFDVEGLVVDTPAEPNDAMVREGIRHTAYPTVEKAGIVFAYMGPADRKPLFPNYAWATMPGNHTYVTKSFQDCNYLQGLEGECDSSHLSFLHRPLRGPFTNRPIFTSLNPAYDTEMTDFGLRLIATRSLNDAEDYVRISSFVMPNTCWVPARNKEAHIYVPIDDTHSWRYDLGFVDHPVTEKDLGDDRRQYLTADYRKKANLANDYLQDRAAQKIDSFTGMKGFLSHDSCATESMGPRFDRSKEYLGFSDLGVVAVRKRLLTAVRDLEKGKEPPHLVRDEADNCFPHIDTFDVTLKKGEDWRGRIPSAWHRADRQ